MVQGTMHPGVDSLWDGASAAHPGIVLFHRKVRGVLEVSKFKDERIQVVLQK